LIDGRQAPPSFGAYTMPIVARLQPTGSSFFQWLDSSDAERKRMLEAVDLFREADTVDELGIGAIRDAFADRLFPGTSTIQTRARYFLFVPWICRRLEPDGRNAVSAKRRLRALEIQLIAALRRGLAVDKGGLAGAGLIGVDAGERTKRLPSAIYWGGLGRFGIRLVQRSLPEYLDSLPYLRQRAARQPLPDGDEIVERVHVNWHAALPEPPEDLLEESTFTLSRIEAEYLRERIAMSAGDSLLAHLATKQRRVEDVDFVWQLPDCQRGLSAALSVDVGHARLFSEVMHGAQLLYNLLLSELVKSADLVESYGAQLDEWSRRVAALGPALAKWDREEFWALVATMKARVGVRTRLFVDAWLDLADDSNVYRSATARTLVYEREVQIKRTQARVLNQRARDRWNGAVGSGTAQMSYRWLNARRLLRDVATGRSGR
jgi:hypothetical protein